jgi:hypothetical protein
VSTPTQGEGSTPPSGTPFHVNPLPRVELCCDECGKVVHETWLWIGLAHTGCTSSPEGRWQAFKPTARSTAKGEV